MIHTMPVATAIHGHTVYVHSLPIFFDQEICYCFSFLLSTIIPFITKSSNTNTIFERSNYYLDTLIDSAGDNNDYDTSIVMLL